MARNQSESDPKKDKLMKAEVTTIVEKAAEKAELGMHASIRTVLTEENAEAAIPSSLMWRTLAKAFTLLAQSFDNCPSRRRAEKRDEWKPPKRSRVRGDGMMALMLRHISGKRDFDLFATPLTDERLFSQENLQAILSSFSARRLSPAIQERLSEVDSPMHFYDVSLDLLFDVIIQRGFPHARLEDAILEVLSHRHDYKDDDAMQAWMRDNLLHVKYDLSAAGTLVVGETVPMMDEQILVSLDDGLEPKSLRSLLPSGGSRPLVILAGSWT
eukprot:TRINITY_DN13697_c0_g1_i1.p1 TRINITY_DN13697_c0_g1~~TRINITY_DN13697_c0_g1_i1.p1  ORF type:complete len:271 (-),score=49.14 TRINITY_DN13697_c0_g1_i1:1-813(-)